MQRALVLLVLLGGLPGRAAAIVPGGGLTETDCTVVFGGVDATHGASGVVCRDGDAACDRDGAADGACRFDVSVCRAVTADGCDPRNVSQIDVVGAPLAVPALDGTPGVCGAPLPFTVPVGGSAGVTALARSGDEPRDVDYLNLCCSAAAHPLDALDCAVRVAPSLAGCSARIPRKAVRAFATARRLADQARRQGASPRVLARVRRQLRRVQQVGRRLAGRDRCGNTLALLARHALEVL